MTTNSLTALWRGDVAAFMTLMKKYERLTFAIAYGIVRNRDDASEAGQHGIENAFRHLRSLADRAKFKSWFSQIVRNEALTMLRQREGDTLSTDDPETRITELPDPVVPPDAQLALAEEGQKVHRVLAKMSPDHAEVLSLFYLSAMSYEEIAKARGVSIGTISSRINRAKAEFLKLWRTTP